MCGCQLRNDEHTLNYLKIMCECQRSYNALSCSCPRLGDRMLSMFCLTASYSRIRFFRLPYSAYYNGDTAAIWQTAGKLFQKKNAMNHLFIAFLIPYSIFSLVVRPCVQQRLRGCCEDFDFSVRQLIQQRFKLHPLRGLALHSFTMKNLIHRDMIAGHQF